MVMENSTPSPIHSPWELRMRQKLGVLAHTCQAGTEAAEAGGLQV